MAEQLKTKSSIKDDVNRFIFNWHEFPFDYWWRKKYNIPFGSQAHREMNFIDMYIEHQEELLLKEVSINYSEEHEEIEDMELGIHNDKREVVKLSKEEIDDDYENLDLSKFDK